MHIYIREFNDGIYIYIYIYIYIFPLVVFPLLLAVLQCLYPIGKKKSSKAYMTSSNDLFTLRTVQSNLVYLKSVSQTKL